MEKMPTASVNGVAVVGGDFFSCLRHRSCLVITLANYFVFFCFFFKIFLLIDVIIFHDVLDWLCKAVKMKKRKREVLKL